MQHGTKAFLWIVRWILPCTVLCITRPETVQADGNTHVTHTWRTASDFEACIRDGNIDLAADGPVQLIPREYIVADMGYRKARLRIGTNGMGRKLFDLGAHGAAGGALYAYECSTGSFNGVSIQFQSQDHGAWSEALLDKTVLRPGTNEFLLPPNAACAVDTQRAPPAFSLLSEDAGRTWHSAAGEFLAHLLLYRYPARGELTSEVIDLANPEGADVLCPRIAVDRMDVRARTRRPRGTEVLLEVRSGSTLRPDATWSAWGPVGAAPAARYLQWRTGLRTTDPARTPALREVRVGAEVRLLSDPRTNGVRLAEFRNRRIVRSSYPYLYQVPSPRLKQLREQWRIDAIVAPGKTELEKFVLLRNWARRQWPSNDNGAFKNRWDALDILAAPPGDKGMCSHYAILLAQCAMALGYVARPIVLNGHFVADVWSHEHDKWVVMDVESVQAEDWTRYGTALYVDRARRVPLSALEIHRALVQDRTMDIVQLKYLQTDGGRYEPVERTYGATGYQAFLRFAYPPRNNYLDQAEPWEYMHGFDHYHCDEYLWWRDDALGNTREYSRATSRTGDVDWTVDRAELTLTAGATADALEVAVDTVTPNFRAFLVRADGGPWTERQGNGSDPHERQATWTWPLRPGTNRIEVKTQNVFGIDGAASTAVVVR